MKCMRGLLRPVAAILLAASLAGCETMTSVGAAGTAGDPPAAAPVDFPQLTCAQYGEPGGNAAKLTASRIHIGDPYYMEFRERRSPVAGSGHIFVVFGALDKNGEVLTRQYIGLFPVASIVGFLGGAIVPVPAQLIPEKRDCYYQASAAFRVSLTREQYEKLVRKVRGILKHPPLWQMFVSNCNQFAADLGTVAGLKPAPASILPSFIYIHSYIDINTRDQKQTG